MTQCKCEHWQQCPVCMPHRFDAEGKLLPPEPTPLQAARTRIAELERQQAVLVEALEEARDEVVGWAAYASEYFQQKHNLKGYVEKLDATLASVKGNA